MKQFAHLHVHTEYSLLDGFVKIEKLFKSCKEKNITSIAITDHGSLYGAPIFYERAIKEGVKPIIGAELYLAKRNIEDKDSKIDKGQYHLTALAKNEIGYKNLVKLVSISHLKGMYYKPRVDLELLEKYSEGLIILSGCLKGPISVHINENNITLAIEYAKKLKDIFDDDFYIELQNQGLQEQTKIYNELISIAKHLDIKPVVTNDVHYIEKDDAKIHDILLCIQTNQLVSDTNRMKFANEEFYLKDYDELLKYHKGNEKYLDNTIEIADKCNFQFDFKTKHMPKFSDDSEEDKIKLLRKLCNKDINNKYDVVDKKVLSRLEFELNTIINMGYVDYFLIAHDFVKYAKENDIYVGPGRGSAAGSIVSYLLNITEIDPLKYNLIFERFLNPDRISMPDIDIDFEDENRNKILDYVTEKYGKGNVCHIITYGTLAARSSIRDVGRVLNVPYSKVNSIVNKVPFELNLKIKDALDKSKELNSLYLNDKDTRNVIDIAMQIEGMPRHLSTHAAGVIISDSLVTDYIPVTMQDDNITAQYDMIRLEELGYLKMDFLGLKNLTLIKNTIKLVNERTDIKADIHKISYNDKKVYDLITSGNTYGVFQLESRGMKNLVRSLKPKNEEDICACLALFRPGPSRSIPTYLKNRQAPDKIVYLHNDLESILDVTYGCIIYQEQVMQIVRVMAGYSYSRSDLMRRAMSKKKAEIIESERNIFVNGLVDEDGKVIVNGCIRNGYSIEVANEIYDQIISFANYAFVKSHAVSYGRITYQTAYLKSYYPLEFYSALLSMQSINSSLFSKYINDAKSNNINILSPCINKSESKFLPEGSNIRYSLSSIKGIGTKLAQEIVIERKKNGKYIDFENFIKRNVKNGLKKNSLESIIKAGCFKTFGKNISELLLVYENVIVNVSKSTKQVIEGQMFLLNTGIELGKEYTVKKNELDPDILISFEKEILGCYLTNNPLDKYKEFINSKADQICDIMELKEGKNLVIVGIVSKIETTFTKKQKEMASLSIEDYTNEIEVIVFPNIYEKYKNKLKKDNVYIIIADIDNSNEDNIKLLANDILDFNFDKEKIKLLKNKDVKIYIRVDEINEKINNFLKNIKGKVPGNDKLLVYDKGLKKLYSYSEDDGIDFNQEVSIIFNDFFGNDNIKIVRG